MASEVESSEWEALAVLSGQQQNVCTTKLLKSYCRKKVMP